MSNQTKVVITGEDRTKAAFSSINRQMGDLKSNAAQLGRAFGAVFGAISVGGLIAGLKSVTGEMDRVSKAAQKIGTTTESLSALEYAAQLADVSVETLQKSLTKLARGLDEAKTGSGEAAKAFDRLKIDPRTFSDPADAMKAIAERFASMPDGATKTALAMQLFGKSGADLIPLLNAGASGIAVLEAEAKRLGVTFSTEAGRAAEEFNDNITRLQTGMRGFMMEALSPLIPMLVEVSRAFVDAGKGADGAGPKISGFGMAVKVVLESILILGANVKYVFETMGMELSMRASQAAALLRGNLAEAKAIGRLIKEEGIRARRELDEFEQRVLNPLAMPAAAPRTGFAPGDAEDAAAKAARAAAAKAAAAAAARDRKATHAAELALRAEQSAQAARLEQDELSRQIAGNKAAFDVKLINASAYYTALTELQRQQAASEIAQLQTQRAAAEAVKGSAADKLKAQADIVKINTDIELIERRAADQAAANAASNLAVSAALKLRQDDFIAGLELEVSLIGLTNDERETALMLLEAEKLGITDVNRLLELQGQIRKAVNDKAAAAELQRQQDDLYKNVQQGVQKAFADGLNAVGTDGGFTSALQGLVNTIKSALSNALAASLTDSFLGMLGGKEGVLGMAGSLGLGGKKDGSTPASAIYVSDVAAGGALGGGDEEGGGLLGGIASTFQNMFSGIGNMLSGLFSSLMSGLGSLLSGIGGGMSSMMSGLGGLFGFAEGGWTGPGSKYQPAGLVHADEFVFDKVATNRIGVGVLENMRRIASGRFVSSRPRTGYAEGGLVNLPGSAAPNVTSNTKVVNMFDLDSAMAEFLNTRGGERAILNVIQRNPGAAGA